MPRPGAGKNQDARHAMPKSIRDSAALPFADMALGFDALDALEPLDHLVGELVLDA